MKHIAKVSPNIINEILISQRTRETIEKIIKFWKGTHKGDKSKEHSIEVINKNLDLKESSSLPAELADDTVKGDMKEIIEDYIKSKSHGIDIEDETAIIAASELLGLGIDKEGIKKLIH